MNERRMIDRIDSVRDVTVSGLVSWCLQRELEPDEVTISGGHLKWVSEETDAEKERREEYQARSEARHEAWERATWERLNQIYGDRPEPQP